MTRRRSPEDADAQALRAAVILDELDFPGWGVPDFRRPSPCACHAAVCENWESGMLRPRTLSLLISMGRLLRSECYSRLFNLECGCSFTKSCHCVKQNGTALIRERRIDENFSEENQQGSREVTRGVKVAEADFVNSMAHSLRRQWVGTCCR